MRRLLLALAFVTAPALAEPEPFRVPIMEWQWIQVPGPFGDPPIADPAYIKWQLWGAGDTDDCIAGVYERASLNIHEHPIKIPIPSLGKCENPYNFLLERHGTFTSGPVTGGTFIGFDAWRIPEPGTLALLGLGLAALALRRKG